MLIKHWSLFYHSPTVGLQLNEKSEIDTVFTGEMEEREN
jgi:hypothetical protein